MALAGAGLLLGLITAAGVTRYLASQLFHVNAIDPVTYGGVTVLLGGGRSAGVLRSRAPRNARGSAGGLAI